MMMDYATIIEVGARDGLQNEIKVPTIAKVALIEQLIEAGISHIEGGAFVSAKWVPQMADSAAVLSQITPNNNAIISALTPNLKGAQAALASQVDEFAIFTAASEAFCQKNINCSIAQSIDKFKDVAFIAKQHQKRLRGYVSTVLGCPYQGDITVKNVVEVVESLFKLGVDEVSLGDTIGVGTPNKTKQLFKVLCSHFPAEKLACHFHDTYGQALANIYSTLEFGVRRFDSSVAGLGGCPYAQGASGNLATEDLVYMLQGLGITTGIDLEKVAKAGWEICDTLGKRPSSRVSLALKAQHDSK